jgi:methylmalonyl-CoA/ethylmalonyl-CoA epimerase
MENWTMMNDTPVHLNEIAQIAVTVTNLDEARTFYRDVLGMHFLFDAGSMAFFQCGAVRLLVGTGGDTQPGGGTILYFRVADLEGTHAGLKARDVEFAQEPHLVARMKTHDLWLAFLKDPSGNVLGLMEEKQRAAGDRAIPG